MWEVTRKNILLEIKSSRYLAILADETTDISERIQLVIIIRLEMNGVPVERFWGYFNPKGSDAASIADVILNELAIMIPNNKEKLIAQSYDGAAVMSRQFTGVQKRVKEHYAMLKIW